MYTILLAQGQIDEARQALEAGAEAGNGLSQMRLAIGHIRGLFGSGSDPEFGFALLSQFTQESDNKFAMFILAQAYEQGNGTEVDLERARGIYETLAADGHAMSLLVLGNFEREGTFDDVDLDAAAAYYRASAENGFDFSWLVLARLSLDLGNYDQAEEAFQKAIDADVDDAEAEFARAHFLGELGPLSDRSLGAEKIESGAESGDVELAAAAIRLWERRSRRIQTLDLERVIALLDQEMRNGDEDATKALARAYRTLGWRIPQARARHAEIVSDFGDQLGKNYYREFFHTSYDPSRHTQSRAVAYDVVQSLHGEDFDQAARALRATEMTAFVYLLQQEFASLGYYNGRASGTFNGATLRATMQFCEDQNIMDTCTHGPLRYSASIDIIEALASVRG
jgi:tetratricopeptide (TPR) repeat protein